MRAFALFIAMLPVGARAQVATSAQLEMKSKLEREIGGNLENSISTKLEKGTFGVAVHVQLVESSEPKPAPKQDIASDRPLGLDMGAINVEEIMRSYERELDELRVKQANHDKKDRPPRFNIMKIDLDVGLSSDYPEDYRKTFETWLKSKIAKDYGKIAQATVSVINKVDPPPPSPKNFLDRLHDFQHLAGMLALGFLVSLGLWLAGRSLVTASKQQQSLSLQSGGRMALDVDDSVEEPKELPAPRADGAAEPFDPLAAQQDQVSLHTKIAFVCMELKGRLNELVRVWIDGGDEGMLKAALLIDAMVSAREKIMSQSGALPMMPIPLDEDLVASREEHLAEAYRRISQMDANERGPILKSIYWDLISVRTLGLQSLRRPFDFLSGLEVREVKQLLDSQQQESRALALMYMPDKVRNEVFERAGADEKQKMIAEVLSHSQIPQRSIWDSDTATKVTAMSFAQPNREKLVNLFPRTIEVLSVLNSIEEIRILRNVTPSLPNSGREMKTQYVCLAFMDEWRPEYIRKLASVSSADEITALLRVMPTVREVVLEQCPPKVRLIVEDDLGLAKEQEDSDLRPKIDALKLKWMRIVQSEKIQVEKIFNSEGGGGHHENAA